MSIAINSTVPLVAAQGVTADVVLQPGTVVNAQVLQLLGDDQVRIAVGGQSLDVVSQVPLQAGQTLQLSVSQTADGNVNLAVVNQPASAAASQAAANPAATNATSDAVTLTSAVAVTATPANAAPQPQLTALQSLAVSVAAQIAATEQTSLAPLFANLGVAAASGSLPTIVQQAAVQVLAQQTILDQGLTGTDIQQAFQSSGLFLEASLAQGSISQGTPDLKAALIVLRQVLNSAIDSTTAAATLVPADGQAAARQRQQRARRRRPFCWSKARTPCFKPCPTDQPSRRHPSSLPPSRIPRRPRHPRWCRRSPPEALLRAQRCKAMHRKSRKACSSSAPRPRSSRRQRHQRTLPRGRRRAAPRSICFRKSFRQARSPAR